MLDQRGQLLRATVGFAGRSTPSSPGSTRSAGSVARQEPQEGDSDEEPETHCEEEQDVERSEEELDLRECCVRISGLPQSHAAPDATVPWRYLRSGKPAIQTRRNPNPMAVFAEVVAKRTRREQE